MSRARRLIVAFVALLVALAIGGGAARAIPPGPELPLEVNACSTDPGGLSKLDKFLDNLRKFHTDLFWAAMAGGDVQTLLGEAITSKSRAQVYASEALAELPDYRSKLDKVGLDFDAMQRSSDFTGKRGVASLIKAGLGQIDGGIAKFYQAGDWQEMAANAILAMSYDAAEGYIESAAFAFGDGDLATQAGELKIASAIAALGESSSCKDASDVAPPLSANRINRLAGGGGTQRRGGDELSVVAPKKLELKRHGSTKLPMTLRLSRPGMIELWLARGEKLIINLHIGALEDGKAGLLLNVPHTASKRKLTLKLAFYSSKVNPIETINLTIRPD